MNGYLKEEIIVIMVEEIECFYCLLTEILIEYEGIQKVNIGLDSKIIKIIYQEGKFEAEKFIKF